MKYFAKTYQTQIPTIASSYAWTPKDTSLDIDAVQAFTKTLLDMASPSFTQSDFNNALKTTSFQGLTGDVTFQANTINSRHISDRTDQNVYTTCYDYQHILHLVDSYAVTTDKVLVQELSSVPNITSCD